MHFRCFFGLFCAVGIFGSIFVVFCLCFLFIFLFLGLLFFETSCISGVSLVCFVLLGFLDLLFCSVLLMFSVCFVSFWDFCF